MERIHMNDIRDIIYRLKKGESIRAIHRDTGHARKTIRKYRDMFQEQGLLGEDSSSTRTSDIAEVLRPEKKCAQRISTVEPYREKVKGYLENGLSMKVILRKLREEYGYRGSYSSVRRFCRRIDPKDPEGYCRVETKPAEEAQVDFASVGKDIDGNKVWAFVMTLSWSRHQYVEFVHNQKMQSWLQCHENAFRWFGGVVRRVVIDNLKAAVLKRHLRDPVLSEPYRRLARHYGFMISPNRPRTPRHKGKVERGIRYLKGNFIAGEDLETLTLGRMNEKVKVWVMEVAGVRDHGTTHQRPLARYNSCERSALSALPEEPFEDICAYRAKLHHDCHVVVDSRYYSAPSRLIGKMLDVYVGRRVVEIYHGTDLVATHPLVKRRGGRSTRNEHYPPGKREWLEKTPQKCRQLAEQIGRWCHLAVDELLSDRVCDRLPSVHSLLRLKNTVGAKRLEAACRRAVRYGDPRYIRVKTILEAGLEYEPLCEQNRITISRQSYRYNRDASSFFETEVM